MKIRILGGHNIETNNTGCVCILVDNVLAVDTGALTSSLSLEEQGNLKVILLSHHHYDHVKDIPLLGMNFYLLEKTIEMYTTLHVYETLKTHLFDDVLYPDFTKLPPEKPVIQFKIIEPGKTEQIAGYNVLPINVNHAVPSVGYQIEASNGKKVFITADTGPDLGDCWKQISPDLLLIETTLPNRDEDFARKSGHLTPALLQKELESFRKIKGYIPQVIIVHMNPLVEKDLKTEIEKVEKTLNTKIRFGYEGMQINI